ncbi:Lipoprotein-anchoring transpeptidase ErfK/SrfK [Nocardiopsis flavescens]|uniref:Lipoprotein-anchoring transpeptidase ErfK/SrfK n=1 Tax=Nocardiopsis flavescens TaxID=758803 RepID=A0A1M6JIR0_9ACTN|nr:Ig-like domain-containing protein [Nocardiopsis flavescens]SHJ46566.1 Lipoprotein-anchoring transpeptidase ErfK/SrfK [Nocardiopsis flavescens]
MGTIPPSALRRCGIALAALALAATACTPSEEGGAPGGDTASQDAVITIAPETGAEAVAPDTPVTVTAEQGTLTGVTVDQVVPDQPEDQASPFEMTGTLSEDGTSWVADWSLAPGAAVTVTATADNAEGGGTTELVHEFTTADAVEGQRLELSHNFPTSGETVGVGMPITIGFDLPVTEKAAVESALKVVSEQGVAGSWRWLDDKTAVFRPETYWEPYQEVSVEMHLAGVRAAEGVYGVRDHRLTFEVGRELRLNMNVPDHEMVVTVDGEETRTIPVSNGDGTSNFSTTSSGTHVLMERHEKLLMDSDTVELPAGRDGYSTEVQYAVRTSNSGEFLHEASYNSNIGSANTSNGCTNMRMDDAKWIFENTLMGDVLDTTGTDRVKEWHNGWGYWQLSWDEWLAESATGEPQVTDGSNPPGSPFGQPAGDSEEE